MDHFAGLDVSVKETSVCIVDDTGRIADAEASSAPARVWFGLYAPKMNRVPTAE
jgi:hypothetical protein